MKLVAAKYNRKEVTVEELAFDGLYITGETNPNWQEPENITDEGRTVLTSIVDRLIISQGRIPYQIPHHDLQVVSRVLGVSDEVLSSGLKNLVDTLLLNRQYRSSFPVNYHLASRYLLSEEARERMLGHIAHAVNTTRGPCYLLDMQPPGSPILNPSALEEAFSSLTRAEEMLEKSRQEPMLETSEREKEQ